MSRLHLLCIEEPIYLQKEKMGEEAPLASKICTIRKGKKGKGFLPSDGNDW